MRLFVYYRFFRDFVLGFVIIDSLCLGNHETHQYQMLDRICRRPGCGAGHFRVRDIVDTRQASEKTCCHQRCRRKWLLGYSEGIALTRQKCCHRGLPWQGFAAMGADVFEAISGQAQRAVSEYLERR